MELLQFFANLLQGLTSWFPRPYLVNVTERAVLFRRGKPPVLKDPGFHWYTPLFSDYETYSLLKDPCTFDPAVLPTKEGRPVSIGFVIVWHIEPEDIIRAATSTNDTEEMIGEIGESLLPPLVLQHTFDELLERVRGSRGMKTVNATLTEEAQDLLAEYGVTIDYARVNFLAPTRVLRLLQG